MLVLLSGCGLVLQATPPPLASPSTVVVRPPVVVRTPQGTSELTPTTPAEPGATTTTSPELNVQSPAMAASLLSQVESHTSDARAPCAAASRATLSAVKAFDPTKTPAAAFRGAATAFAADFQEIVALTPAEGFDKTPLVDAAARLRQEAATSTDPNALQASFQAMLQTHVAGFSALFAAAARTCPDLPPLLSTPVQELIDSMKPI